tara:strand:+ start:107 stop:310 length:204 start_codon:yes stop_codon:yes gene_type:complete
MYDYDLQPEEEYTIREYLVMQPKLNQIRLQMLKDLSKSSRMDMQNTMNRIIEVVYMDPNLRKQIFKK